MDPFTIMLLASAGLGALQGQQSAQKRKEDNIYRKAVLTYRPWTGLNDPGASEEKGDLISGAAGGALTGAFLGKGLGMKGGESWFQPTTATTSTAAPMTALASAEAPQSNLDSEIAKISAAQSEKVSGYPARSPQSVMPSRVSNAPVPYRGVPQDPYAYKLMLDLMQQQQYGR